MTYITIKADGNIAAHDGLPTYEQIGAAVGGWLEAIRVEYHGSPATMYLNEEGKLDSLPRNARATAIARGSIAASDWIAGDVLLVGLPDEHGNDTSLLDPYLL